MESLIGPQADLNSGKESSRHHGSFSTLTYRRHHSCGRLRCQCPKGDAFTDSL